MLPWLPLFLPSSALPAQVITSEIDEGIDGHFRVVPGCGNFGDRQALGVHRMPCMPAARERGCCV